jgi:hypothetical protein
VRQGISTDLYESSVEKLQREGLIKSHSSADKKYVLGNLYYEFAQQPAYIKEYRVRDLQIVAGCFEKAKEVFMKDFVEAFDNQLSREQVRHLIAKLEEEKLIRIIKAQKYTRYTLNYDIIGLNENIYSLFYKILSE